MVRLACVAALASLLSVGACSHSSKTPQSESDARTQTQVRVYEWSDRPSAAAETENMTPAAGPPAERGSPPAPAAPPTGLGEGECPAKIVALTSRDTLSGIVVTFVAAPGAEARVRQAVQNLSSRISRDAAFPSSASVRFEETQQGARLEVRARSGPDIERVQSRVRDLTEQIRDDGDCMRNQAPTAQP